MKDTYVFRKPCGCVVAVVQKNATKEVMTQMMRATQTKGTFTLETAQDAEQMLQEAPASACPHDPGIAAS